MEIDPVTVEIIRNSINSCAEDMNATLVRSAFSPIIFEGRDCAVALHDSIGKTLGQSSGVPVFLGNMDICVQLAIERYGDDFEPGDVIIMNDSYLQGTHLHDVTTIAPIFHQGQCVVFAATRAHWQDIGGMDAGTTTSSTSIFQEGLRLGPTRIARNYEIIREWESLLRYNSRLPDALMGDLKAQISAMWTSEKRVDDILQRFGLQCFNAAKDAIFKNTATSEQKKIAGLPDGTFKAEGFMDNDGYGSEPVPICVTVTIEGDKMIVDLDGTSPAVQGGMNCGLPQTVSVIRLAYQSMINPGESINGGSFLTLETRVPDDCMLNAKPPSACEWYFSPLGLLGDLMIDCLGQAMPQQAVAASFGDSMIISFCGYNQKQGHWVAFEPTAGGWGGFCDGDGESALINLSNGSFRNIPAEVYESRFPIRINEFSIRKDSCGAGQWRGGCGVVRSYTTLEECDISLWFERSLTPGWGIYGGSSGQPPAVEIQQPDGVTYSALKMKPTRLPAGTVVQTKTGGGGGYGNSFSRCENLVAQDIRDGFISMKAAKEFYGVVFSEDGTINSEETKKHRAGGQFSERCTQSKRVNTASHRGRRNYNGCYRLQYFISGETTAAEPGAGCTKNAPNADHG